MLRGKRSGLQRPGRIRPAAEGLALAGERRRGQVRQVGVEPVVAEFGRGIRVPFRPVVQVLPGQSGELLVTAAVHIASGVADHGPLTGPFIAGPVRGAGSRRPARAACLAVTYPVSPSISQRMSRPVSSKTRRTCGAARRTTGR